MYSEKTERIGSVLFRWLRHDKGSGSNHIDWDVEERKLHKWLENLDIEGTIGAESGFKSRAIEYHFSPLRHNVLKWFPFDPNGSLLEIGAEYGDLTGLFCEKTAKVTALESCYKLARMIAKRHTRCDNLEVIAGRFQDVSFEQRFDYITVIGALKQAATFCVGKHPYNAFLSKISEMLKLNGVLILATENEIGLDYIIHKAEGYTRSASEPCYNGSNPSSTERFNKKALSELLHSAGFVSLEFFYPFPDYRLPQKILSDATISEYPNGTWNLGSDKAVESNRPGSLSRTKFRDMLSQAGLLGEFANSFLVVARRSNSDASSRSLGFVGANRWRRKEFRTNVRVCEEKGRLVFVKSADSDDSMVFLQNIVHRDRLARDFFDGYCEVITGSPRGDSIYYPYLGYPTLEDLIANEVKKGDIGYGVKLVEDYIGFIHRLPSATLAPTEFIDEFELPNGQIVNPVRCILSAPIDCIPCNILENKGTWYIVDNEWTYDFAMPIDFLIYRGIYSLVINIQEHIQDNVSKERPVVLFCGYGRNRTYIPSSWLDLLYKSEISIDRLHLWEWLFKRKVLLGANLGRLRLKKKPKLISNVTPLYRRVILAAVRRNHRLKHGYNRSKGLILNEIRNMTTRFRNLNRRDF